MNIYYRYSRKEDKPKIKELVDASFGNRDGVCGIYKHIEGKYLLAIDKDNGKFVGMSGFVFNKAFNALEISWTCVLPEYRKQGIMHNIFKRLLSSTDELVYCSCWRIGSNPSPNLVSLLRDFNFLEVVKGSKTTKNNYNCFLCCKEECFFYEDSDCHCYEDLYIRCQTG